MLPASGILLAAGRGKRFGATVNKAFVEAEGRPLLSWSLEAFIASGAVGEIVLVVKRCEVDRAAVLVRGVDIPVRVVPGGDRRQDSSLAGIEAASGEIVLIHDAARPLISPGLVRRVLEAAAEHGAAVPVVPVSDTLRYVRDSFLTHISPGRMGLHAIQTPQGFRRDLILSALREARAEGWEVPDDAAAVLKAGHPVAAVPGDPANLKLTFPGDLEVIRALLHRR